MKAHHLFSLATAILCLSLTPLCLVSCSSEDDPSFSFATTLYDEDGSGITLDLYGDEGATYTLPFSSACEWTAAVNCTWLTLSQTSGNAGTISLVLTNADDNDTAATRTATLTLTSADLTETISLTQDPAVLLETDTTQVDVEGTDELYLYFSVNMSDIDDLYIYYGPTSMFNESTQEAGAKAANAADDVAAWENEVVGVADGSGAALEATTRSGVKYYVGPISVQANTTTSTRLGYFYFYRGDPNTDPDCALLATQIIEQAGVEPDVSTDYTADGTVLTLQSATVGGGIPIILMGDGFLDTDIADGTYDKVMNKAMENLFTEEPMTSLREYFSVYEVQVISQSNSFGSKEYTTALGSVLKGGGSTYVEGDDNAVYAYMELVEGIDTKNALAVVILNCNDYAGTTFFRYYIDKAVTELAIAYCPIIYDLDNESFREVLVHEAIGHGFAKLADEYYYSGTVSSSEIAEAQSMQTNYGWMMNIDFTSDPTAVLWAQFLTDDTYTGEELGVYEGGYTYSQGVYRPSYESMMNSNQVGFNAPSRQEIYSRVIEEVTDTVPSYEDFRAFDIAIGTAGKPLTNSSTSSSSAQVRSATGTGGSSSTEVLRPHPPVAVGKVLR